jgi:peptide/nickel transport system substrate-binding protein
MYTCGLPGVEELGKGLMGGQKDFKVLAENVRKAGYTGEKIILLSTADLFQLAPMAPVLLDVLTRLGMNVEMQSLDLSSMVARRASQASVAEGGWSLYTFLTSTSIRANPVVNVVARGLGLKGYPGNYEDQELEDDITAWVGARRRRRTGRRGCTRCISACGDRMPIVPLCTYGMQTAFPGRPHRLSAEHRAGAVETSAAPERAKSPDFRLFQL